MIFCQGALGITGAEFVIGGDMAGHKKWNRFENAKATKVELHPDSAKTLTRVTYTIPPSPTGAVPSMKSLQGRNLIVSKSTVAAYSSEPEEEKVKEVVVDEFGLRWPKNRRFTVTPD